MSKFRRHFFVCQNRRSPKSEMADTPACGARGGEQILATLAKGLEARPDLWAEIAVAPTGCLGHCEEGPTMVVYPEGTWYVRVTPADAAEIVERHVCRGEIVERLVLAPKG